MSQWKDTKSYKTTRAPQYHTAHNIFVHPKIEDDKKGEKERNITGKEKKRKNRGKKDETKIIMHALRAQAESRGDKVAVCWYDQFYDMSS